MYIANELGFIFETSKDIETTGLLTFETELECQQFQAKMHGIDVEDVCAPWFIDVDKKLCWDDRCGADEIEGDITDWIIEFIC